MALSFYFIVDYLITYLASEQIHIKIIRKKLISDGGEHRTVCISK